MFYKADIMAETRTHLTILLFGLPHKISIRKHYVHRNDVYAISISDDPDHEEP